MNVMRLWEAIEPATPEPAVLEPATLEPSAAHLSRSVKLYCALMPAVAVVAFAAWMVAWPESLGTLHAGPGRWTLLLAFTALAAAGHLYPLQVTRSYKLTLTDAHYFAALLLFGAPVAMLVAGLGSLAGNLVLLKRGKRDGWNVAFNAGHPMLSVAAAGVVFYSVLPRSAPFAFRGNGVAETVVLAVAAVTLYVMETFPTCIAVALLHRKDPVALWTQGRRVDVRYALPRFLMALMGALEVGQRPWTLAAFVLPIALTYLPLRRALLSRWEGPNQAISLAETLADTVDRRTVYTLEHSKRVAGYAVEIGRFLGLAPDQLELIRLAARVHDVGKIGVPEHVLRKSGELTTDERAMMDSHVRVGYEILERFPEYRRGRELVRLHRTPFGSEPPPGLDPELLLGAQIIGVADALDAMTSERPYRQALTLEEALTELRRDTGALWHPDVVRAVERLVADPEAGRTMARLRLTIAA